MSFNKLNYIFLVLLTILSFSFVFSLDIWDCNYRNDLDISDFIVTREFKNFKNFNENVGPPYVLYKINNTNNNYTVIYPWNSNNEVCSASQSNKLNNNYMCFKIKNNLEIHYRCIKFETQSNKEGFYIYRFDPLNIQECNINNDLSGFNFKGTYGYNQSVKPYKANISEDDRKIVIVNEYGKAVCQTGFSQGKILKITDEDLIKLDDLDNYSTYIKGTIGTTTQCKTYLLKPSEYDDKIILNKKYNERVGDTSSSYKINKVNDFFVYIEVDGWDKLFCEASLDSKYIEFNINNETRLAEISNNDYNVWKKSSSSSSNFNWPKFYNSIYDFFFLNKTKTVKTTNEKTKILLLGDSITVGYYPKLNNIYDKSKYEITKIAESGKSTKWMLDKLTAEYNSGKKYDYIFVMGGANDIGSTSINISGVKKNLTAIYNLAKKNNTKVIALSITPGKNISTRKAINDWVKSQKGNLIDEYIDVYDNILNTVFNGSYTNQNVHNPESYTIYSNAVNSYLV